MDKNLIGLIGAVSVLAMPAAHAATAVPATMGEAMQASSYADLLKPVPNALALLKASAAAPVKIAPADEANAGDANVEQAQFTLQFGPRPRYYHHHHHHHHHYYRRYYHHHHHHHHSYNRYEK